MPTLRARKTAPDEAAREQARHDREHNLLVQAGAGSGKTTVLTERLECLLSDPRGDLARVVAITFTEKAAGELKARLRTLCDERFLSAADEEDRRRWGRHRRQLESAHIGTIHGFCTRLLRVHALRLGLDPYFTVMDEAANTLFVRDCLREHVLDRLREGAVGFAALVAALSLEGLVGALTALTRDRAKLALNVLPASPEAVRERWAEAFLVHAEAAVAPLREDPEIAEAAADLEEAQPVNSADPLAELRAQTLDLLAVARAENAPCQAVAAWAQIAALRLPTSGASKRSWSGEDSTKVREALKALRDRAKEVAGLASADEAAERSAAELTAHLGAVLPDALEAYAASKREQGALDFDDLILLARDLLRDYPEVRAAEQQRFEHLLVDEFQDTDPVQRELIWYLAEDGARATRPDEVQPRPGKLFVVGDAKQSIYAFRGADVTVYDETRREFGDSPTSDTLSLTANFRSQPRLVAFLNDLFTCDEVMGLDRPTRRPYEAFYERLEATRAEPDAGPDVSFLLTPAAGPLGELRAIAADRLARYLADAVAEGTITVAETDAEGRETRRAVRWRDILVLLPTMTNVQTYERALNVHGVPYYLVAGRGFYHRPEVLDVVTLLRVLDDPTDEVALARFLRSPCCCVSDEGLYWLAREQGLGAGLRQVEVSDALRRLSSEDGDGARRAADFLAWFRELRDRLPLSELIARLLEETALPAIVAAQFGGQRAYANLQKLVEVARSFEAREAPSLARFIAYVETLRTQEIRESEAPAAEESDDVVTLLTIHKAKGLQAPVVVAADLARGGARDSGGAVILHPEVGPVVKGQTAEGGRAWPPVGEAARREARDRELAEDRRLLYVALTRAQDRLIISTPVVLGKEGALDARTSGPHVQALFAAFGDRLLSEGRWGGASWEAEVIHALEPPADVPPARRRRSLLATQAAEIAAGQPLPIPTPGVESLLRGVAAIGPDLERKTRFTVTELSRYLSCPRCYELQYVLGVAPQPPAGGLVALGRLRPVERGRVIHRALQRLGRGPAERLGALVEASMRESGLAGHDPSEVGAIVEALAEFARSDTWRLVSRAEELRTEVPVVAPFELGLLEGQIDALLIDADGRLHLLDYKTGREPDEGTEEEHRFQVGAYAAALERCRGQLPASLTVHYLDGNRPLPVAASEAARSAAERAESAMRGICAGAFPACSSCTPSGCAYAWACRPGR